MYKLNDIAEIVAIIILSRHNFVKRNLGSF